MAGAKDQPLVTVPHGGPHGTYTSEFSPATVALALEGCQILPTGIVITLTLVYFLDVISLVNYTGSLGFGQKYVDALIGRAGSLDVKDCYESAKHLIAIGLTKEGPGMQFVQGGSHGGFLSAHRQCNVFLTRCQCCKLTVMDSVIGQYPDFFSATVMRNPVIAVGEIASVSDIPDWAFDEFGVAFGPQSLITPNVFESLQKASPIAHIDAVKAPVLLLIGEADQRVPPSQSKNYYYGLKGRGKEVEMLMFPNNGHSLDSVEAELVGWEASKNWFARFAKR